MKHYLPLVLLIAVCPNIVLASDKGVHEGQQLVEQAEAKANIFALPSFEIVADIRINNGDKDLDGSYRLIWNGPGQWREEISFPTYSEVQVGAKGIVFLKRTTDVIPMRIDQLRSALGYDSGTPHPRSLVHLAPDADETIRKIHNRIISGTKVACVEIASQENQRREVCVDELTGAQVRQRPLFDKEMMVVTGKVFSRLSARRY